MTALDADTQRLQDTALNALADLKAQHVTILDVRPLTSMADVMIIASGTSTRHVRALADEVQEKAKAAGFRPVGVEGEREGEWVLIDLAGVIVHVMLPATRVFYDLERLWTVQGAATPAGASH
ncbi:ribosome silencing factor [Amnimonas aquatica]|uniref:Ribosomal silencing factor RsfS n=1 Tax=Amnimonas aquatica TaxID=2094561 RepID=A0A2P6AT63_9GAMM|nr:ribosome silencing factor [Amnimonas aquatica]PQA44793.1 ribosome silencing factor [Amnimonas aquatica]